MAIVAVHWQNIETRAGAGMVSAENGFCRDCLTPLEAAPGKRCRNCGSPRLVIHDEIDELAIAHVDCDAFYAAIEKRDAPELRDKPVIVGGGRRGVVSTACYIARISGVHSAMPMFKARKLCPDAIVIRPDMAKYAKAGREIRNLMTTVTPLVEPLSIDEAFMDLSGTAKLHKMSPALTMAHLAEIIEREIGITVSIGLSFNKFLAKIASDLDKPRGFAVIGRSQALDFLGGQPVSLIWGVGKALKRKLERDQIRTIADLRTVSKSDLVKRYGAIGGRLYHLARAEDNRRVTPSGAAKSISAESTFAEDIADRSELERRLWLLCEKVARRSKAKRISGRTVTLKLKTAKFKTLTRTRSLEAPTSLAAALFEHGQQMLAGVEDKGPFRLIGIGLANLDGAASQPDIQLKLADDSTDKLAEVEAALDNVRDKFGDQSIVKGRALKS
jgi:DNA polymerase-4